MVALHADASMTRKRFPETTPARDPKVRVRRMGEFGGNMPETAQHLFAWVARQHARAQLDFSVGMLPPTVNHMYVSVGGRRILSGEAQLFRDMVAISIGHRRFKWRPTGVVMAMVFLQSPVWLTAKNTVRDVDADNRLKALFDAVEAATAVPDCTVWQLHCWKVPSETTRTVVYFYDLGDLVDSYP